jgi:hypothetical protein
LTLRGVFRLPLRQTEGLISAIIRLLGLELSSPDHTTLCRRAETLQVFSRPSAGAGAVQLWVHSTGLKLNGAGEWLVEKYGPPDDGSRAGDRLRELVAVRRHHSGSQPKHARLSELCWRHDGRSVVRRAQLFS